MKRLILITMLCLLAELAFGDERWSCTDFGSAEVLVVASSNDTKNLGTISVAGVKHNADYRVQGFNRRWNFGTDGDGYPYSFVIKPDGTGLYYDFTSSDENVKASMVFKCKK